MPFSWFTLDYNLYNSLVEISEDKIVKMTICRFWDIFVILIGRDNPKINKFDLIIDTDNLFLKKR